MSTKNVRRKWTEEIVKTIVVRVEILLLNGTFPQMFARHEGWTLIADGLLFLIRQ